MQVEANELWIEMGNVEEGIVEIIARHHIRWLVMGAAADEHYSEYASAIILLRIICFLVMLLYRCRIHTADPT